MKKKKKERVEQDEAGKNDIERSPSSPLPKHHALTFLLSFYTLILNLLSISSFSFTQLIYIYASSFHAEWILFANVHTFIHSFVRIIHLIASFIPIVFVIFSQYD